MDQAEGLTKFSQRVKSLNIPASQQTAIVPFMVETFQMDALPLDMCPESAQMRFSKQTVAALEKACAFCNELTIEALYLDPTEIEYELTFFNERGEEVDVESQMELKFKLLSTPTHLQIILSANDTKITDDDSNEGVRCTGEFFGDVHLSVMKERLAQRELE